MREAKGSRRAVSTGTWSRLSITFSSVLLVLLCPLSLAPSLSLSLSLSNHYLAIRTFDLSCSLIFSRSLRRARLKRGSQSLALFISKHNFISSTIPNESLSWKPLSAGWLNLAIRSPYFWSPCLWSPCLWSPYLWSPISQTLQTAYPLYRLSISFCRLSNYPTTFIASFRHFPLSSNGQLSIIIERKFGLKLSVWAKTLLD